MIGSTKELDKPITQPHTVAVEDAPWILLTHIFDDLSMRWHGKGACVMSCQKCGGLWLIQHTDEDPDWRNGLLSAQESFKDQHLTCGWSHIK